MGEAVRVKGVSELDELCIDTIRFLAADAVQKAKAGHPGMPMGLAPAAYTLWMRHLKFNPANPKWFNRDRFVLSGGHGCMLLYSLLYLTGYDMTLDDLKNFRQWGSKTPGHPEYKPDLGIEATTGPLGQGISNAVGMAIAQKYTANYFNRDGFPVVDYKIYVTCGDGDLEEGISSEASSLAGHLALDNLIVIYDDNHITIDGSTSLAFTEELTINMFVWITLLGTSIGFKKGSHLAVTFLVNMFPKRMQKLIFVFTSALCIGLFILLIICAVQQIISEYQLGSISDDLGVKVYRYTIMVPVCTLLIIFRICEVTVKHLKEGSGK